MDENVKWCTFSGSKRKSIGLMSDLYIVVVLLGAKIGNMHEALSFF